MIRQTNHVMEVVKIRRGGEKFWAEVIGGTKDAPLLKCNNKTFDVASPRYGEEFELRQDDEIVDRMHFAPKLRLVSGFGSASS